MKKRILFLAVTALIASVTATAQNENDVLRYSQTGIFGSSRSMGAGNAFGALGADFSALVTNPAGLARYRKSEIGATINLFNTKTNTFYIDNTQSDNKFNLNFNTAGLAVAIPTNNSSGWRFVNLGFGVNRLNNFSKSVILEGVNTKSSIVHHFEQTANGHRTSDLGITSLAYLAWYQYLIDTVSGSYDTYYSDFTNDSVFSLRQRNLIDQSGGMNDISISAAGNYDDKLYIGGSLNIYKVKFREDNTFIEDVLNNSVNAYKTLTLQSNISTSGTGLGAKLGFIALPTNNIRFGVAYHTPARIFLTDKYNTVLSSTINKTSNSASTPDGTYDYSVTIPGKIAVSGAFILGKSGFISADYEYIDYRNGKLTAGTQQSSVYDTFTLGVNSNIRRMYRGASNIRIGAEYLFSDVYTVRAGMGLIGSPYSEQAGASNFKTQIPYLSAGFGIRNGNYFLDMALVRNYGTSYYAPYTLNPAGKPKYYTSETQSIATNFTVSLGFKF